MNPFEYFRHRHHRIRELLDRIDAASRSDQALLIAELESEVDDYVRMEEKFLLDRAREFSSLRGTVDVMTSNHAEMLIDAGELRKLHPGDPAFIRHHDRLRHHADEHFRSEESFFNELLGAIGAQEIQEIGTRLDQETRAERMYAA